MRRADFVIVSCLLDDSTRHLINAQRLALMRKTAYLINVARGPIVDERALIAALRNGSIAGAALDVFEQEPVAPDNPLLTMDNVIVTPHSLCWTDECFDAIARAGLGSLVDFATHRQPVSVVNREVLAHPAVAAWLKNAG
jgi:phosphoglycerate dehydrogenase-like enzyme